MIEISHSPAETTALARKLALSLPRGSVLLLEGDLGAGKTAFTRGFVSAWDLQDQVSSPTFTVMNEYRGQEILIYHFDLYRLTEPGELAELGLEEFLDEGDYSLIEWPALAASYLPEKYFRVTLSLGQTEQERIISIQEAGNAAG